MSTDRVIALLERARTLVAQDEFSAALALCDGALALDPADESAVLLKAWLLSSPMPDVSDAEGAIALLRTRLSRKPDNWRMRAALADALIAAGEYVEAEGELLAAERFDPKRAEIHHSRGLLLGAPKVTMSSEESEGELREACRLEPERWDYHRDYAKLLWQNRKNLEAAAEYSQALECVPPPDPVSEAQIRGWLKQLMQNRSFLEGYSEVLRRK